MTAISTKINIFEIIKKVRRLDCNEIRQYLNLHKFLFWSWGASMFTRIQHEGEDRCLRFRVNGRYHKGHVYIVVNGSDLFDVYLTSIHGTLKHELKDIYIEDLFANLDRLIETNKY